MLITKYTITVLYLSQTWEGGWAAWTRRLWLRKSQICCNKLRRQCNKQQCNNTDCRINHTTRMQTLDSNTLNLCPEILEYMSLQCESKNPPWYLPTSKRWSGISTHTFTQLFHLRLPAKENFNNFNYGQVTKQQNKCVNVCVKILSHFQESASNFFDSHCRFSTNDSNRVPTEKSLKFVLIFKALRDLENR